MVFLTEPEHFDPHFEVAGCLLEHEGQILVLERQDHKPQGGSWGVPAGKLDPDESHGVAMVREMQQETGYTADEKDLRFLKTLYVRYPDYDFVYYQYHTILNERPNIVINPSEHKSFRWVTPKEALSMNLIPGFDSCINIAYGV